MGALVQLDASLFAWLEDRGPVLALHGAIDDATGTGLALVFRPAEDLHGYGTLLHTLGTTYGLPLALYGDRPGVFVRNDAHWTLAEELRGTQDPTHFGRIRQALGIGYIAARSPQAKGRIERFWQTRQDRLVSELRLRTVPFPAQNEPRGDHSGNRQGRPSRPNPRFARVLPRRAAGPPLAPLLTVMVTSPRITRRLHVRKHVSWTAWIKVGKTRIRCHTVDLSANGARLKPRGEFRPGTPVEVQLQPPDGPLMDVAGVVWRVDGDSMAVMFLRNLAVQVTSSTRVPEHGRRGWR